MRVSTADPRSCEVVELRTIMPKYKYHCSWPLDLTFGLCRFEAKGLVRWFDLVSLEVSRAHGYGTDGMMCACMCVGRWIHRWWPTLVPPLLPGPWSGKLQHLVLGAIYISRTYVLCNSHCATKKFRLKALYSTLQSIAHAFFLLGRALWRYIPAYPILVLFLLVRYLMFFSFFFLASCFIVMKINPCRLKRNETNRKFAFAAKFGVGVPNRVKSHHQLRWADPRTHKRTSINDIGIWKTCHEFKCGKIVVGQTTQTRFHRILDKWGALSSCCSTEITTSVLMCAVL